MKHTEGEPEGSSSELKERSRSTSVAESSVMQKRSMSTMPDTGLVGGNTASRLWKCDPKRDESDTRSLVKLGRVKLWARQFVSFVFLASHA
jgi:hypothetical protein